MTKLTKDCIEIEQIFTMVDAKSLTEQLGKQFLSSLRPYGVTATWKDVKENILKNDIKNAPWLHIFAYNRRALGVQLLLEKGCDIEKPGLHQETVFEMVAKLGDKAVMEILLDRTVAHAANGVRDKALIVAAEEGHEEIVQLLVMSGANVDSRNHNNQPVLILATRAGHKAVVQVLLQNEADVDIKGLRDETALMTTARKISESHEEIMKILLDHKADIGAKNCLRQTALNLANDVKCQGCIKLLKHAMKATK